MFTFITKYTQKNHCLKLSGVCLHFKVLKCFAVPVQQCHSTHTQQNPLRHHLTTQNTKKSFDPYLRTKPNYFLSKLLLQEPQQNTPFPHHLSPALPNYPYLTQTLINPTQINKISSKIPHPHNTPTSNPTLSTNPNKTLLKLRIIQYTPKISTLI